MTPGSAGPTFRRDLGDAVTGQTVVALASVLRTFLVPVLLGSDLLAFASWQAYLLYLGYVSLAFFGFNDGLYLRHARLTSGQVGRVLGPGLGMYALVLVVEAVLLVVLVITSGMMGQDSLVWVCVLVNIPLAGVYGALVYHLQLTRRIRGASLAVVVERLLFTGGVGIAWATIGLDFGSLVASDIGAKAVVVLALLVRERRTLASGGFSLSKGWGELRENARVGVGIMLGAYAALLFSGVPRVVVQVFQPAVVFANVALAVSLTTLILLAGQAVTSVIYPRLARMAVDDLGRQLSRLQSLTAVLFPIGLLMLLPLVLLLRVALPQFEGAERYLPLLLVSVQAQIVLSSVNNTFHRLLGVGRRMLVDNLSGLLVLIPVCLLLRDHVVFMLAAHAAVVIARVWLTQRWFESRLDAPRSWSMAVVVVASACFVIAATLGAGALALYAAATLMWLVLRRATVWEAAALFRNGPRHVGWS